MKKFLTVFFSFFVFINTWCSQINITQPKIIIWWSTNCPHCVKSIPLFEKEIYNKYKNTIDIYLNVLSENLFETIIPQKTWAYLNFEDYTGRPCNYIPSWVIIDKKWEEISSSCWGEKSLEDMEDILKNLF